MADVVTTNYNWVKPEVGASNDTWGAKLNANFDAVDAKVKSLDFSTTAKATPVGADRIALFDSAASNAAKYVTVANLKAAVDTPVTSAGVIAALGYTPVTNARTITAGNGLTGGGDLTANRSLALGVPGTITSATTNEVTASSHTHNLSLAASDISAVLGYTPASQGISIVAGNGMTGGGALSASRTITMGTPASITATSTNVVSQSSHTHDLSLTSANIISFLGYTPANAAISIVAGNGMSGGGTLAASRTITMGTPGTITNSSTSVVTSTSHNHALGIIAAEVSTTTSNGTTSFGLGHTVIAIGTASSGTARNGDTDIRLNPSNLSQYGIAAGTALAGTWRNRGSIIIDSNVVILAQRTA